LRLEGDWEGWMDFFLDGVATIAGLGRTWMPAAERRQF